LVVLYGTYARRHLHQLMDTTCTLTITIELSSRRSWNIGSRFAKEPEPVQVGVADQPPTNIPAAFGGADRQDHLKAAQTSRRVGPPFRLTPALDSIHVSQHPTAGRRPQRQLLHRHGQGPAHRRLL
jgi:hypothetical protein